MIQRFKQEWDDEVVYYNIKYIKNDYVWSYRLTVYTDSIYYVISSLYVNEPHRNKGYLKEICDDIFSNYKSHNYTLQVDKDKDWLISAYLKNGFEVNIEANKLTEQPYLIWLTKYKTDLINYRIINIKK